MRGVLTSGAILASYESMALLLGFFGTLILFSLWYGLKRGSPHGAGEPTSAPELSTANTTEHTRPRSLEAAAEEMFQVIDEIVQLHSSVLVAKRRQKLFVDDYGRLVEDAWNAEIEYFRRNILDAELTKRCEPVALAMAKAQLIRNLPRELWSLDNPVDHCFECRLREHVAEQVASLDEELASREPKRVIQSFDQYEEFCAQELRAAGWNVRVCGRTGDQGVDIVADRRGVRAAFQCKFHKDPVGNGAIQEVYAGMRFHGAWVAVVVSSSGFTASARAAAAQTEVVLLHHSQLGGFSPDK